MIGVARELQVNRPNSNYRVAKVNCAEIDTAKICDFFSIPKLPRVIMLRADMEKFFAFPFGDPMVFEAQGILDFVNSGFEMAYSSGFLDLLRKKEDMTFTEGLIVYIRNVFMTSMEENYIMMRIIGIGSDYRSTYVFAYISGIASTLLPLYVLLLSYLSCKYCCS